MRFKDIRPKPLKTKRLTTRQQVTVEPIAPPVFSEEPVMSEMPETEVFTEENTEAGEKKTKRTRKNKTEENECIN